MDQSSKGQGCLHDPSREDVGRHWQVQEEEQEQALIDLSLFICRALKMLLLEREGEHLQSLHSECDFFSPADSLIP